MKKRWLVLGVLLVLAGTLMEVRTFLLLNAATSECVCGPD